MQVLYTAHAGDRHPCRCSFLFSFFPRCSGIPMCFLPRMNRHESDSLFLLVLIGKTRDGHGGIDGGWRLCAGRPVAVGRGGRRSGIFHRHRAHGGSLAGAFGPDGNRPNRLPQLRRQWQARGRHLPRVRGHRQAGVAVAAAFRDVMRLLARGLQAGRRRPIARALPHFYSPSQ